MRKYLLINISFVLLALSACNKEKTPSDPEQAVLLLPLKDEACITGTVLSETENSVQFTWASAKNTDTYGLAIKNLLTGKIELYASSKTEFDAKLSRNTPYSWFVVSKSEVSTNVATSETWKFYNSGFGTVAYSPYPADIIAPAMGQNVVAIAGKIKLEWAGSDADNDLVSYDIYFGTSATPPLLKAGVVAMKLEDVSVFSNTTYYWKVVSKDAKGNSSESTVFQFIVK